MVIYEYLYIYIYKYLYIYIYHRCFGINRYWIPFLKSQAIFKTRFFGVKEIWIARDKHGILRLPVALEFPLFPKDVLGLSLTISLNKPNLVLHAVTSHASRLGCPSRIDESGWLCPITATSQPVFIELTDDLRVLASCMNKYDENPEPGYTYFPYQGFVPL